MIGYFVRSADDDICFVRLDHHAETVQTFRYCDYMHIANLILKDGREEMVSVEIAPPIHAALLYNNSILIVDMVDNEVLKEYVVPLSVG